MGFALFFLSLTLSTQRRTAQKSLIEISELQTQLVDNLATQSAHIDQLVADSMNTTENVGGGNKQLKKAKERNRDSRVWLLIFLIGASLSLLFLEAF